MSDSDSFDISSQEKNHSQLLRRKQHMERPEVEVSNKSVGNLVVRAVRRLLLHTSYVVAVETPSPHFRLLHLQGEALKGVEWMPGQQIQITTGAGLTGRTYTPISWHHERGVIKLLIFLHGNGPGCTWARTTQRGSRHDFLGPTKPLKLALDQPFTLFGDETTFGLGLALQNAAIADVQPRFLFEVSDPEESQRVLDILNLRNAVLIRRAHEGEHHAAVVSHLLSAASSNHQVVLSGDARSIQQIKKAMKTIGLKTPRLIVRPYWSPGKTGMS
jgi:ferric-chelate reductase (NADPH)